MPARKSKSKSALRGSVNNIIITCLVSGEKYGYEIIKEVEDASNGKIKLKQPSLYSSLSRFEQKGYITSYWQDSEIGGKRHYYKITDEGLNYYKKNILKDDQDDEEIESAQDSPKDNLDEEYEIDTPSESDDNLSKYSYNVEDKINALLSDNNDKDVEEELYEELDNEREEIFDEDDLTKDQQEINSDIAPDHEFSRPTPLLKNVDISNNAFKDIVIDEPVNDNALDDITNDISYERETSEIEQPINSQTKKKIVVDDDGITHFESDDDEIVKKPNKVFDNVVLRTSADDKVSSAKPAETFYEESDEDKELRSKRFMERFDNHSQQYMKETTTTEQEQPSKPISVDYKSKINSLFDNNNLVSDEIELDEDVEQQVLANKPDNFSNEEFEMKVFAEEKKKVATNKFLQVNKAKFIFGLILMTFMLAEITSLLIIFKKHDLIQPNQFWIFEASYIIIAVVTLCYCLPVFISPNKQASNVFRLGYSILFGLLGFFITIIFVYALNTFLGMEMINLKYYLATLVVPAVLALNLFIGPIIYWLVIQNKKLY